MANSKRRTKICVLPKMEETRLVRAHFLLVTRRYQVTFQKRETSWNRECLIGVGGWVVGP